LRKCNRELPQPLHQPPVQVQFQPQRANAEVNSPLNVSFAPQPRKQSKQQRAAATKDAKEKGRRLGQKIRPHGMGTAERGKEPTESEASETSTRLV
jgi:N-acetyl-beta-hexosaminidase